MVIGFIKQHKGILLILLLSLILRLILLNQFPTGMTYDELHFVLNAKAIALTGHDMSGQWSPWQLSTIPNEFPTSELSFVPIALLLKFLPLNLFTSRLPYAIFGVGSIFFLYLIVKKTIGKRQALAASMLFAINPWSLYLSRSSFDVTIALFFFLLGLYLILVCKRWLLLLSYPALFFAFYSYIGTKLIFIPFVLFSSLYSWYEIHEKKFTKYFFILTFLCCLLFLFFVFRLVHSENPRTGELFLPNSTQVTQEVNSERMLSLHSPLTDIFSNKFIVYAKQGINRYFATFSTQSLFIHGDGYGPHLAFDFMGLFYYPDAVVFFFGIYWIFKRKPKEGVFFLTLLCIAQIPSALHVDTIVSLISRSTLFFPFFCIFTGCGIYGILAEYKDKAYTILVSLGLILVYSLSVLYFFYSYFFRYPIYNSEAFFFSSRLLSNYITREQRIGQPVYVVVDKNDNALGLFRSYIFYNNLYNASTVKDIQLITRRQEYSLGNVHFLASSKLPTDIGNSTIIIANGVSLHNMIPTKPLTIAQLKDSGKIFSIYNGVTCTIFPHNHFIQNITFRDLHVETLSNTEFCKKYIIQY